MSQQMSYHLYKIYDVLFRVMFSAKFRIGTIYFVASLVVGAKENATLAQLAGFPFFRLSTLHTDDKEGEGHFLYFLHMIDFTYVKISKI